MCGSTSVKVASACKPPFACSTTQVGISLEPEIGSMPGGIGTEQILPSVAVVIKGHRELEVEVLPAQAPLSRGSGWAPPRTNAPC